MTRHVPQLSLRDFTEGAPAARAAFSDALFAGLKDYGFIILTDHNAPPDLIARAYDLAEQAFALPEAAKRRYAQGLRGYTPFGVEHAKDSGHPDLKEFWQIGREPTPEASEPFPDNVWPAEVAGFRDTFQALYAALDETGRLLLRALAPRLDLPEGWFDPLVRHGTSILRVLHYPPVAPDTPEGCVRSAAHEDINFLTIMLPARGKGLELLDRDGAWLGVGAGAGELIVNSGDMLARMTNEVIPATTHRVVNPVGPNVSRYSMPFFMHPASDVPLKVLPACLGDGPRHPEITAGEYLAERLREIGLEPKAG
ncbi:MAG TPA: 2-oxoglutarate and iron-dependent oxygenase domain-containing protein [Phenylobacterium sp.]|nr:2-oxoglutarate and iron-dependent oxygenase domain-containing protein [Phenylobacterium sp.]